MLVLKMWNVYPNTIAINFMIRQLFWRITFLNICENWKISIYSIQLHMLWNSKLCGIPPLTHQAFILPSNSYQKGAITRKSDCCELAKPNQKRASH